MRLLLFGLSGLAVSLLAASAAPAADLWPAPPAEAPVQIRLFLTHRAPPKPLLRPSRRRSWLDAVAPPEKNLGLFLAAEASLLLDMGQTLDMARYPGRDEANPILGRQPSRDRVLMYFGSAAVTSAIVHWALPDRWANVLSRAILAVQLPVLDSNARIGLTIRL